jgi:ectoine hydroxylase-related dioxygenase (phytanoyl-CoA dioxygenase family)
MNTNASTQFYRDGYVVDRNVFDGDTLRRLRELAGRIKEKTCREFPEGTRYWTGKQYKLDQLTPEQRALATWGVNEITRPGFFEPDLVNVFAHPRVSEVMHALLGPEPRAWGIKILWTPRLVAYNLQWHRDQMKPDVYDLVATKPAANDHIQFNAALNQDNCFVVVPGSHRRKLTPVEWNAVRHDPVADLPGQLTVELEPGDILYMDAHALHRGRSDTSLDRLTLHYSAQAQWVPLKPWGDPSDFAWIQSDTFIHQLHPDARPLYERLRTARRTDGPIFPIDVGGS